MIFLFASIGQAAEKEAQLLIETPVGELPDEYYQKAKAENRDEYELVILRRDATGALVLMPVEEARRVGKKEPKMQVWFVEVLDSGYKVTASYDRLPATMQKRARELGYSDSSYNVYLRVNGGIEVLPDEKFRTVGQRFFWNDLTESQQLQAVMAGYKKGDTIWYRYLVPPGPIPKSGVGCSERCG